MNMMMVVVDLFLLSVPKQLFLALKMLCMSRFILFMSSFLIYFGPSRLEGHMLVGLPTYLWGPGSA